MLFEKVAKLCGECGISIARLERECKIGNGTISGWKNSSPNVTTIKKIADFFGKPLEYFVE